MPTGALRFLRGARWSRETRAFLSAALGRLLRGHRPWRHRHRPPAGHAVPMGFVGICVASSADPGTDAYVVERLRELAIPRVRVDYSYDSPSDHGHRLLEVLLAESFSVLLHLVQPLAAARWMDHPDAQEEWRQFVAAALDRYGQRVEAVEIGSTVNRRRWAGYNLQGFLCAWRIAWDEAHRRGMRICGPNVTDFEPLYTAGLLKLLRQSGRAPDVYTNNLFVERVIEPEVFDHRVAGRLWSRALKLNLVKKARLLQQTAQHHGVETLWNGYVSWTHPRIARLLPNVEAKQADYLLRYLVLMAASGAMQRVYWGPLISRREGLIDDPNNPNPLEELVTFNGAVHGPPSSFRQRLAFQTLRQFAATIPGSRYLGRGVGGDGLEVHAFESAERLTHVVWTRNAMAARLADIYSNEDLDAAVCHGRDGESLAASPLIATEAPVYLCWPAGRSVRVDARARPIANLSINLNAPGGSYFPVRDADWQGMLLARDAVHAQALLAVLHPARIGALTPVATLRKARNAIWTVRDPLDADRLLVVKQPVKLRAYKRLIERFRRSKATRSFSGASELLRRGIASPRPVAYFERSHGAGLTENWYVCEYQPGRLSVRSFFTGYAAGETRVEGLSLEEFLVQLVPFLVNLHDRGVYFRDLSGGNVLVGRSPAGELEFSLIDTARAHFSVRRATMGERLSDLKRLGYKLHWDGRCLLMERYLDAIGRRFTLPYRIPFYLYDLKVGIKRRARRSR
ncbi:MAG: lipopolysaccharide kinase InaA family protein [Pseudomonadales bacterium]